MVSVSNVKRWDTGRLDEIVRTVGQRLQILTHSGDDYARVFPVEGWAGAAADQAGAAHQGLMLRIDTMAAGAGIVTKALGQAADAITGVQHAVINAEAFAEKYGYRIADDGAVVDSYPHGNAPPELHPGDRARVRTEVADAIAQALRTAADIDDDLASVLTRAAAGDFGTGGAATVSAAAADATRDPGLTLLEPPKDGTPGQSAGWWSSLSPAGQAILLRDHPDWLGNLDGLPGAVRSAANVARIPAERADLQRQLAEAQSAVARAGRMPFAPRTLVADTLERRDRIQAKLDSLGAVEATMARGDRQLLTLDTSGERVKAAVAVGNVDTAEHVAVFTPGFTTTVDGSLLAYDQDMRQLHIRAQGISDRHGDHAPVAAVTWIGYEAPQITDVLSPARSVANDDLAVIGAHRLDGFLDGIGASHDIGNQPLHLTALGHSYGSLTTGIALQQETPVDDAVVFGSPGLGVRSPNDLKVPLGHVHSEWADEDYVPDLAVTGVFGPSPYQELAGGSAASIGQFSTEDAIAVDGRPLHATHDHGQYLEEKSTSQYNMAAVVAGRPDLAVRYVPPWDVPSPPSPPTQPLSAAPGRVPQPPPVPR